MSVRRFKVGELCLHRGRICRVLKVERNFFMGHEYMGIKDGTEYNPSLTLLPLYGTDNQPVKKPRQVVTISGSVESVADTITQLKHDIAHHQARIALLEQG